MTYSKVYWMGQTNSTFQKSFKKQLVAKLKIVTFNI